VSRSSKKFDGIFVGGDITSWGEVDFLTRFLNSLGQDWKNAFFVPGNHDPPQAVRPGGSVNLHGKTARVGRYSFGGLGGSNVTPFGTPFEIPDDQAVKILESLGRVDVLISHCPPFGTNCDVVESGLHVGSKPVREYIERESPTFVLCGHVHEARGQDTLNGTRIINPGSIMDANFAVVEMNDKLEVELSQGEVS
jgi:Icc-related predicted phosphoesterase